jgi:hypothetical protein
MLTMKRIHIYVAFIAVLATACTERIDVKLDDTYTRLVVDGSISSDTCVYVIHLTKTADYFFNESTPRVVAAEVKLTDGSNEYLLHETEPGKSGEYQTDSTFAGKVGATYTLNIELPEKINNQSSYSSSCKMMNVARLDSIAITFQPDWGKEGFWEIKLWAQDPGNEVNYYMFHYYRNDTLKTDSIWKVTLSDDQFFNGNYIDGITAVYIDNENDWETLRPGDKVTLQMSGITKEYYDFISQVQMAGYNIPFFTGPPANVEGNISNGGVGFFSAYSDSWGKTVVK